MRMSYMRAWLYTLGFLIGIILFGFSVTGLFTRINFYESYDGVQALQRIQVLLADQSMADKDFLLETNTIVHDSIIHYWPQNPGDALRVPFRDNYFLWFASFIKPSIYRKYEFCRYDKAIERGVGLCSQAAIALTDIAERKHVEAHIVHMAGHVVVVAKAGGDAPAWLYLDPYFNVVIEMAFEDIEANPDSIRSFYQAQGLDGSQIDEIVRIVRDTPNHVFERGVVHYTDCNWKKMSLRQITDVLKWILPLGMMAPFVFSLLKTRRQKAGQGND